MELFSGIKQSAGWKSIEKIDKGWSADEKYLITTDRGRLLLRLSDISKFTEKKKEYEAVKKISTLGFKMSMPVEFGECNDGRSVYMLLTWLEGVELEEALPKLSDDEQYRLGRTAGSILKKIHSMPVSKEDIPQRSLKEKKLQQLQRYEESSARYPGDEVIISYVRDNINKICVIPPVLQHGDFHPGNLILTAGHDIGVIDFNRWDIGDPYEEFYKLESFGAGLSVPYCVGQIDAYFDGCVPRMFWEALSVYVAHASLYSIKWAEKFGRREIDRMTEICRRSIGDFDSFKRLRPRWYRRIQLLYGTGNSAKITAMRNRLAELTDLEITGLMDLDRDIPEVEENGVTPLDNARQKAFAYYREFKRPVFSCDSGLYFDNIPEDLQPGIHVRRVNGKCLSDSEMIDYYSGLALSYGNLTARYRNAICLVIDDSHIYEAMDESLASEPFILTSKPHRLAKDLMKAGFPLDSMSVDIKTGQYYYDLEAGAPDKLAVEDGFLEFFKKVLGEVRLLPAFRC